MSARPKGSANSYSTQQQPTPNGALVWHDIGILHINSRTVEVIQPDWIGQQQEG